MNAARASAAVADAAALRLPVTRCNRTPSPVGVFCADAWGSSVAAHQNFRRPWCVLRGRAPVAGVHEGLSLGWSFNRRASPERG
jgi:hypothetical protein